MPIFEYQCPAHGVFEVLVKSWRDKKGKVRCDNCSNLCVTVPSLTTMFPDDSWHTGVHVAAMDKTFNSRSQAKQFMKESGIARVEEGMKVGKKNAGAEVKRRLHIEKHLEGYAV